MFTFLHQSEQNDNDFATKDGVRMLRLRHDNDNGNGLATKDTKDTKNGNDAEECYDNDNGSDTKINKGHRGKQRQ